MVSPSSVIVTAQDDIVCIGALTEITSSVSGGSGYFAYQWQESPTVSGTWTNVPTNGNDPNYLVPTNTAGTTYYRLILTDFANGCDNPTPVAVSVTVESQPTVSITAPNPIVCINGSSLINSTVVEGSGTVNYQWQQSPNGTDTWTNVSSGGNGATYDAPTSVVGTIYYRLVITDDANGCTDPISDVVSIQVVAQPLVSIATPTTNLCIGGSTTLTSTITNGSGFYIYQWQSSPDASSWTSIGTGGTGPNFSVPTGSAHTTYYRLFLTDTGNGCNDPISNQILIVVEPQPTVNISVDNAQVCIGGSSLISSVISNGTGSVSYQWQSSPNGTGSWSNIAVNGTNATYSPPNTIAGVTYYRVLVIDSGNGCNDPVSNNVQVIVQSQPTVVVSVDNPNICVNGFATITSVVSNGTFLLTYQWQSSPNGSSGWAPIATNGTSASYDVPTSVSGTFYYRLIVTDASSGCNDPISNVVTVVISPDLSITSSPTSISECVGGNDQMAVIVSGGSGTIVYQWQSSTTGGEPWFNATGTGANSANFTPPSSSPGTTYYRVLVNASNSGCGQIESMVVAADIQPDLALTTQPLPVAECVGGTNPMTVAVSGGVGTISYQWQSSLNGSSGWANASGTGANTSNFTPPSSSPGTTYYRAVVSATGGGCGSAISNVVTAIIAPDITFANQPVNITECIGGTQSFSTVIQGGSGTITYQWQSSPDGSNDWVNASGTGSTTSVFTPGSTVAGTTYYRVLVNAANPGCNQAVSNTVSAIITPDLSFTVQPIGFNECVGGADQLTVSISGGVGVISYQWQSSPNGSSGWANASGTGATTATYTPPSTNPGVTHYRVIVNATGNGCGQATSAVVIVEIDADAIVSVAPILNEVCINGTVNLTASVTGGSNSSSVQWQINNSGWSDISGATSINYTPVTSISGTTEYRVRIIETSSGCSTPYSNIVTVVVTENATVDVTVDNSEVCIDGSATLDADITGGSSGLVIQWQASADNSSWVNIPGANSASYDAPTFSPGTSWYRVMITDPNASCADPVSNSVSVLVVADPVVNVTVESAEICIGGTSLLTASVSGGSSLQVLQWQLYNGSSWEHIIGENANTYLVVGSIAGTTEYRMLITDSNSGCPVSITSIPAEVIVQPDAVVTVSPQAAEVCVNGVAVLTAIVNGGSTQLAYQWQTSPAGQNNWMDIAGATGVSYSVPTSNEGVIDYRIVITDLLSGCGDPASAAVPVTVEPDATISILPFLTEVCIDGTALLSSSVTGGSSAFTIQWQSSPNGTSWSNIAGGTQPNYSAPTGATGSLFYRALGIDTLSGCEDPISNTAQVLVSPDLLVSVQPTGFTECVGGNNTMNVSVTGGSGALTYQWQSSTDGSEPWANASGTGSTTAVYTPQSTVAGTTHYRVLINAANSGCDQAISATSIVIITPDLTVTSQPTPLTECVGGTSTVSVVVSGGTGTIGYQWQSSPNGTNGWANASGTGSTTSTYTPASIVPGVTWYRAIVSATGSGCDNTLSDTVRVTITPDINVSSQPISITECVGGTETMSVSITGGVGTISFQWQSSPDGTNGWANASGIGSTTSTYTPSSATEGTTYYRALINATGNGCGQAVSNVATAIISPDLIVTTQPTGIVECVGGSLTMTVASSGGSGTIFYQWQANLLRYFRLGKCRGYRCNITYFYTFKCDCGYHVLQSTYQCFKCGL